MSFRSLALLAVLALVGCSDPKKPAQGPRGAVKEGARDVVVARIDGHPLTAGDVADALARQAPYVRARFTTLERKKAFLQQLVRFEVLVAEARQRKLDGDPEVRRRKKRALVDVLMAQLNKELVTFKDITDAEVAARYERDKTKYQRPAQARAALILLASQAEAKQVLAQVAEQPGNLRHFAELAHKLSIDPESKKKYGDLGLFTRDEAGAAAGRKVPKLLRDAVFALPRVGRVAGPIELTGPPLAAQGRPGPELKGWALVVKSGDLPPMNRPLSAVADQIKNQLFHEKRFKAVTGYAEGLRTKAKVEIDEAALSKVQAPPPTPVPGPAPPAVPLGQRPPGSKQRPPGSKP